MVEVDLEVARIENEIALLSCMCDSDNEDWTMDRMNELYERLEELDAATAETRAAEILYGLGYTHYRI